MDSIGMHAALGVACTDARDLSFRYLSVAADTCPVVELTDCSRVTFDSVSIPANADPFLHVGGARSGEIVLLNSPVLSAKTAVRFGAETPRQAVSIKD
jgi:hypothetical protein